MRLRRLSQLFLILINFIPTVVLSQELDNLVEDTVAKNEQVQLLERKINLLDNQIQQHPPITVLFFPYPLVNKVQLLFISFFSPVNKLQREKAELIDELSVLKLAIQEEVINSTIR